MNQRFIEDIEELSRQQVNITNINIASKFEHLEQTVIRLEEKCHQLEKSNNQVTSSCAELEESLKTMEEKNTSLTKSYFNLEGDYSNLQQKFYKLEENSSVLQESIVTLEKNEKLLNEEVDKLKKNSLNFSDNISEIIAFKDKQVQNNQILEEQLSLHTQVSNALQTKVEKLEERDTAVESWIKDSDISKRLDNLESEKQQTQAKIQQLENNTNDNSKQIERNSSAIMVNKNQIEKLSDVITKEITKMNGTAAETRDHMNSFIAKHNENIQEINDLINVSQSNFSTIDMKIQTTNTNLSIIREENMHKLQLVEDQMKNTNEKIFQLEAANQIQLQKNTYFENLNTKVTKIEEMRQQSEARSRDEVDATISQSNKMVEKLSNDFGTKIDKLEVMLKHEQNALNKYSEGMNQELKSVKDENLQVLRSQFEEISNTNRKLFNDFDQSINSKFRKYEEIHTSELERIENQIQESTFIQAEKVSQNEASLKSLKDSFEKSLLSQQETLEGKVKKLEEETKLNTKSLVEIEPITKSIDTKMDGLKQQIIIENNRHFESIKSEVSTTMMKVTEKNNTVEKHFETFKDNSGKIKEELEAILKGDQIEQMEKLKIIQEETDKALKSSDLLISTVVEKIQNLEQFEKLHNQKTSSMEGVLKETNSKLSNLESADLFLQESHRILTEKSSNIEKEMKQMEQTLIKKFDDQNQLFDNRLKNDINLMQQGTNDLVGSINATNNKLAGIVKNIIYFSFLSDLYSLFFQKWRQI